MFGRYSHVQQSASPVSGSSEAVAAPKRRVVLLVDDDPAFHLAAGSALEAEGLQPVYARRVRDGQRALLAVKPELLVVDGLLPDGDGVRFIEHARKGGCAAPVIFVSAFAAHRSSAHSFLSLKVARILSKPLAPAVLVDSVRAVLALEPRADATGTTGAFVLPDRIRAGFERTLLAHMGTVASHLSRMAANPTDQAARREALKLVHKLAGSAATFGFEEVGSAAAALQEDLLSAEDRRLESKLAAWQELASHVARRGNT